MGAQVQAASAGFGVTGRVAVVVVDQVCVLGQRRQSCSRRHCELEPFQVRSGGLVAADDTGQRVGQVVCRECFHERDQRGFVLAPQATVGALVEQVVGVECGVESVEADVAVGVDLTNPLHHPHAQSQCRVHWHRDTDEASRVDVVVVEFRDGDVQGTRCEAGSIEKPHGQRHADGLMSEFVARDEHDGSVGVPVNWLATGLGGGVRR